MVRESRQSPVNWLPGGHWQRRSLQSYIYIYTWLRLFCFPRECFWEKPTTERFCECTICTNPFAIWTDTCTNLSRSIRNLERSMCNLGRSIRNLGRSIRHLGRSIRNLGRSIRNLGRSIRHLGRSIRNLDLQNVTRNPSQFEGRSGGLGWGGMRNLEVQTFGGRLSGLPNRHPHPKFLSQTGYGPDVGPASGKPSQIYRNNIVQSHA
jgi:hypothetical protein